MIFYFSYLFYYSTSATVLSKFNTDSSLKSLAFNILFNITPTIAAKLYPVKLEVFDRGIPISIPA